MNSATCEDSGARLDSPTFKIGDLVRLKSGGPEMTVYLARRMYQNDIAEFQMCDVCWFVGGDLHRDGFSEPELDGVLTPLPFGDPSKKLVEVLQFIDDVKAEIRNGLSHS